MLRIDKKVPDCHYFGWPGVVWLVQALFRAISLSVTSVKTSLQFIHDHTLALFVLLVVIFYAFLITVGFRL